MKEILKRWKAETPKFFKTMIKVGGFLFGLSMALLAGDHALHLPEIVTKIAGYTLTAGVVISFVSKLAVENKSDIQ